MTNLTLTSGRPADDTNREEKERRVYDLRDALGISYERVDHEAAFTMEACKAIDEVLQPAVICKNLFLCNRQKTAFYLCVNTSSLRLKTRDVFGKFLKAVGHDYRTVVLTDGNPGPEIKEEQ